MHEYVTVHTAVILVRVKNEQCLFVSILFLAIRLRVVCFSRGILFLIIFLALNP